jgi:hypothetical protein
VTANSAAAGVLMIVLIVAALIWFRPANSNPDSNLGSAPSTESRAESHPETPRTALRAIPESPSRLSLPENSSLQLRVLDSQGKPIAEANISTPAGQVWKTIGSSNDNGLFLLTLSPNIIGTRLKVSCDGYAARSIRLNAGTLSADVTLMPAVRVGVKVVDIEDGAALPDVSVMVSQRFPDSSTEVTLAAPVLTDMHGVAESLECAAGGAWIELSKWGYVPESPAIATSITIPESGTDLTLSMRRVYAAAFRFDDAEIIGKSARLMPNDETVQLLGAIPRVAAAIQRHFGDSSVHVICDFQHRNAVISLVTTRHGLISIQLPLRPLEELTEPTVLRSSDFPELDSGWMEVRITGPSDQNIASQPEAGFQIQLLRVDQPSWPTIPIQPGQRTRLPAGAYSLESQSQILARYLPDDLAVNVLPNQDTVRTLKLRKHVRSLRFVFRDSHGALCRAFKLRLSFESGTTLEWNRFEPMDECVFAPVGNAAVDVEASGCLPLSFGINVPEPTSESTTLVFERELQATQ